MTALNSKVEDCFVREGYEEALAMTALIIINCHHEVHFKAVANEVISLCEKWKIASGVFPTKRGSQ